MTPIVSYNPKTGIFQKLDGTQAGKKDRNGYRRIYVNNKRYMEHRLGWKLYYGFISPRMMLDHKNCIPDDNRIENLACVTRSQNIQLGSHKLLKNNKTGHNGICYVARLKHYQGSIWQGGKRIWLKSSRVLEDVIRARDEAMRELNLYSRRNDI